MQIRNELGEAEARLAMDACVTELKRRGKVGVVAVGDSHGELLALWRMDGAALPPIVIAQNKVYTAARVRGLSGDLGRAAQKDGSDVHYHGDARYVGWDGGAPVMHKGQCLGAVAVSGLSGEEDLEIAQLGVKAILETLD
ncbi:heme-binding protein [Asticcacaulis sp. EMRT-3]|uniref:GlcG/HbpS family heme-binding protein n=1 Tax=Asticcacaulis sp. EMRT-3 TaxID=3040349 RepID=UPI0024AEB987|nr:heme-binding protein [Asticcacaulis sp. EMRT-3]MDI7776077.1 heme-binding protein [Asticcacaulis sp. EMRT-3]